MKNEDPFEQQLRRQPLREIPPAWREEILAQARVAADASRRSAGDETVSEDQAALIAGWRMFWERLPVAWAALAALWIVLIGVNLVMPGPVVRVVAHPPAVAQTELLAALDLESADFEIIGRQLAPAPATPPAGKDAAVPKRPHSERRRDGAVGETQPRRWFDAIA